MNTRQRMMPVCTICDAMKVHSIRSDCLVCAWTAVCVFLAILRPDKYNQSGRITPAVKTTALRSEIEAKDQKNITVSMADFEGEMREAKLCGGLHLAPNGKILLKAEVTVQNAAIATPGCSGGGVWTSLSADRKSGTYVGSVVSGRPPAWITGAEETAKTAAKLMPELADFFTQQLPIAELWISPAHAVVRTDGMHLEAPPQ